MEDLEFFFYEFYEGYHMRTLMLLTARTHMEAIEAALNTVDESTLRTLLARR